MPRLELLYDDLLKLVKPLFPKLHPIITTLRCPLSPTPNGLLTARRHLAQLTAALLERCAPVRDADLRKVVEMLADEEKETLPERIVEACRELVGLARLMKADLNNALLSKVGDDKLEVEVVRAAREKERQAIKKTFGLEYVCQKWAAWVDEDENTDGQEHSWTRRLVHALGGDVAVACPLPSEWDGARNPLPPVFFFCIYDLLHLQNYLQALVIAAVLRTLVPLPPKKLDTRATQPQGDVDMDMADVGDRTFVDRILSLLASEVDDISLDPSVSTGTKLVHLAAEVEREHRHLGLPGSLSSPPASAASQTQTTDTGAEPALSVQTKVSALLQPTNPVFVLLRRRLLTALSQSISTLLEVYDEENTFTGQTGIPAVMQSGPGLGLGQGSGIGRDPRKRAGMGDGAFGVLQPISLPSSSYSAPKEVGLLRAFITERVAEDKQVAAGLRAKGFEDPVLVRGIEKALGELADVVEWVRDVWVGLGLKGLDSEGDDEAEEERGMRESGGSTSEMSADEDESE